MDKKLPAAIRSLIDAYDHPFVMIDRDYNIVAANQIYADNYGIPVDQVVSQKCYKVSHGNEMPCWKAGEDCPHRRMFETGDLVEVTHIHSLPDGNRECVAIKGYPIEGEDGEIAYMGEHLHRIEKAADLVAEQLIGESAEFLGTIRDADLVGPSRVSVLLTGESGVGKELLAKHIHHCSPCCNGPLITIDCAGLSDATVDAQMFGQEPGSTAATRVRKRGLIDVANKGTLFLDEIADLTPSMQAKLMRFIDTGQYRRVGGTETRKVQIRVISATNRDLVAMVNRGEFRQDLYFRISGHVIHLPPLRDRRSDLPVLVNHFVHKMDPEHPSSLSAAALAVLENYEFPGNIRELKNIVERAVLLARGGVIRPEHLQNLMFSQGTVAIQTSRSADPMDVDRSSESPGVDGQRVESAAYSQKSGERRGEAGNQGRRKQDRFVWGVDSSMVVETLEACKGSRREAAKRLGISERKVYRLLKKLKESGDSVPEPYQS